MKKSLVALTTTLADQLRLLRLRRQARSWSASHIYDPSLYAKQPHDRYLTRYARGRKRVLLLGMNPGPWGMAQTGVPFGAVPAVRNWLGINGKIGQPEDMHARRPVLGWSCNRVEVSGTRLWSLLKHLYGTAATMAKELVVLNYCPLLLLAATSTSCRNLPLNKATNTRHLLAACDEHLDEVLRVVDPEVALGVGAWAARRLEHIVPARIQTGVMLHPSPASPAANRGFAKVAARQLANYGIPALKALRPATRRAKITNYPALEM